MKINEYIDTTFATDMLPVSLGSDKRLNKITIENEKQVARKYGLDFKSMRRFKHVYFVLSLLSLFIISDVIYNRIPAILTAFIIVIWLLLIIFLFPKYFVYRFSKKITK